ncbi:patatin-like phospholipase family protein [Pseudonocardia sp. TRM90224]|uniref:patatin-like phospholipase family protein n=1 Tax=Pseudonocardia sp. TRM90224 TaxID=2812678 RepID=UPI001E45C896|nr:patatin-like phospholipase family protein [Pseudonocardia sp. TRM90224]
MPPERTHGVAELLADVPLFADVDPAMLPRIVATATVVRLSAGEVLFREGEPGDSLYVVVSGRLEVTRSNGTDETFLAALGRGAMVGETALLTGGARTATVRAVRDSELVGVARGRFAELLADPPFARELTRALAQRLAALATPAQPMGRRVAVVAVASLDAGIPTRPAAEALRAAWPRPERVVVLDEAAVGEPGGGAWAERVERAERDCELVVLVTDTSPIAAGTGLVWTRFALRQADRALVLTRPGPVGLRDHPDMPSTWDIGLVTDVPRTADLAAWRGRCRGHHWLRVGPRFAGDLARAARRTVGTSVGLVLSGGGARGLAHLGVLAALEDARIPVDRLGGTSMGAFVSALAATGRNAAAITARMRREVVQRRPFSDYTVPRHALIRGRRGERMLRGVFGTVAVEELATSWFGISCDLAAGEAVAHREGPVSDVVAASISLPGLAPPRRFQGRLLVDGGIVNNLPVDVMLADGDGPVLAVDVMRRLCAPGTPGAPPPPLPSVIETLAAASGLAAHQGAGVTRQLAKVLITPELADIGLLDWERFEAAVTAGRRATEAAIERIAALHSPSALSSSASGGPDIQEPRSGAPAGAARRH